MPAGAAGVLACRSTSEPAPPPYPEIVEQAVDRLLASHSAARGDGQWTLAVMGIDNWSADPLGDWGEHLYQRITGRIDGSGSYRTLSRRFLDGALRAGGLTPESLMQPAGRRELCRILEAQESPVQLLLFPKLTSGTTEGSDTIRREYLLTLELVDPIEGWQDAFTATVTREFAK